MERERERERKGEKSIISMHSLSLHLGSQSHTSIFSIGWIRQFAYAPRAAPEPIDALVESDTQVLWNTKKIESVMPKISYDEARIDILKTSSIELSFHVLIRSWLLISDY